MTDQISDKKEDVDYNNIFNLKPDPVLSLNDLLLSDSSGFLNFSLSYTQKSVSEIHLIPNVPDSVQRAFKVSKDLFIFGYFRYYFFTVSQHYAFLALEAAIKSKYVESLGKTAILTMEKSSLQGEIIAPTYRLIEDFCMSRRKLGWNVRELRVNNEPFPHNGKKLVQWLVDNKIIQKSESDLYDAGLYLRNEHSHLEQMAIIYPSATILQRIAYQINRLFFTS